MHHGLIFAGNGSKHGRGDKEKENPAPSGLPQGDTGAARPGCLQLTTKPWSFMLRIRFWPITARPIRAMSALWRGRGERVREPPPAAPTGSTRTLTLPAPSPAPSAPTAPSRPPQPLRAPPAPHGPLRTPPVPGAPPPPSLGHGGGGSARGSVRGSPLPPRSLSGTEGAGRGQSAPIGSRRQAPPHCPWAEGSGGRGSPAP